MARLLDEAQKDELRDAIRLEGRDVFPPTLEPARLEPLTHPALPRVGGARLHFAPAPMDGAEEAAVSVPRKSRMDWTERVFEAGWMMLTLGCAAECVYRLLWAVGP